MNVLFLINNVDIVALVIIFGLGLFATLGLYMITGRQDRFLRRGWISSTVWFCLVFFESLKGFTTGMESGSAYSEFLKLIIIAAIVSMILYQVLETVEKAMEKGIGVSVKKGDAEIKLAGKQEKKPAGKKPGKTPTKRKPAPKKVKANEQLL